MSLIELSEDGKRLEVFFSYSSGRVAAMKSMHDSTFHGRDDEKSHHPGQSYWTLPLDIEMCRILRSKFGDELTIGPRCLEWSKRVVRQEQSLRSIASSDTAELRRLPSVLPELYEAIHIGPIGKTLNAKQKRAALRKPASFQAADVRFMAVADNPLNGNHPRLGKTLELIAAVFEAAIDDGPQLVVSPVTAMESVWLRELTKWQAHPVYVANGSRADKQEVIDRYMAEVVKPKCAGWLIVNSDMVRFRENVELCDYHMEEFADDRWSRKIVNTAKKCYECKYELTSEFPELHKIGWHTVTVDEPHKNGVRNESSLTHKGAAKLKSQKRFLLCGTPMGGKLINLWVLLHFLNPKTFSSKWRWAGMWTDIVESEYIGKGGEVKKKRTIGASIKHCEEHRGVDDEALGRPDCALCREVEDAFYRHLEPFIIRRTRKEAMPWVPDKDIALVECTFGSRRHRKQYQEFNEYAATVIDGEDVTATSILAEYTRLKQFAFSTHTTLGDRLIPTFDSGKLGMLQDKLEELGIWDGTSSRQAVIFSQFSEVVDLVTDWLNSKRVPTVKITGSTNKKGERTRIQDEFQAGGRIRCLVMTTTAGGVAITLNRADSCHILDETWDPDDQEQAEDRCIDASPDHQVMCFYYRGMGTIEEYIAATTHVKSLRNLRVLDLRRLARSPTRT